VVFLLTGTATNLPELIALYKTIGRRVVVLYVTMLVGLSFVAGIAINAWLMPGFEPVFDRCAGWIRWSTAPGSVSPAAAGSPLPPPSSSAPWRYGAWLCV